MILPPNLSLKKFSRSLFSIVGFVAIAGCSVNNKIEAKTIVPSEDVIVSNEQVITPSEEVIISSEQVIVPREEVIISNDKLVKPNNIIFPTKKSFGIAQNIPEDQALIDNDLDGEDINIENENPSLNSLVRSERFGPTFLKLTSTGTTNAVDNPLYQLELFVDGKLVNSYLTVTGRANTQGRNRHVSGTEAPLPDGNYYVAQNTVPGTHPEVGGTFLPITPDFRTGRSALGIHFDPSYEKNDGEDGTAGCIAFRNKGQLDSFLADLRTYGFQGLVVDIQ